MKEKEYSLASITVYTYNNIKVKCDYSIIPVKINCKDQVFESEVSHDKIFMKTFKKKNNDFISFIKENGKYIVSIASEGDLEKIETSLKNKLIKEFNKHYWYKFKYKKFLKNKVELQF